MAGVDLSVARWAAEARDACAPFFSGRELTLAVALCLAQLDHESDGNPDAENRIGAEGLLQALSGDVKRGVRALSSVGQDRDPRAQLQYYARTLAERRRVTGSWATAAAAWATGLGGIRAAIRAKSATGEGVPEHVARQLAGYIHPMLSRSWASWAGWVAGWLEAGQPTERATVTAEGRRYTVTLARDHGRGPRAVSVPYDGTYTDGARSWRYSPNGSPAGALAPFFVLLRGEGARWALAAGLAVTGAALWASRGGK